MRRRPPAVDRQARSDRPWASAGRRIRKTEQHMWALFPRAGRPGSVQAAHSAFVRAAGREPGGWRGSIPWKFISTPWKSISMGWKGRDKACKRRRKALKTVRKGGKRAVFRVNLSKTRLRGPFSAPAFRAEGTQTARRGAKSIFRLARFGRKRGGAGVFSQQNITARRARGAKWRHFSFVNTSFVPAGGRFFLSASEKSTNRPRGRGRGSWGRQQGRGAGREGPPSLKKLKAFARSKACLYICKCFHRKIISTK